MSFISKIIALIVSVIMLAFGFPTIGEPTDTEKIKTVYNSSSGLSEAGEYLITSHEELDDYIANVNQSAAMKEYADTVPDDFFDNNNLAIIDVVLADTAETTELLSAAENGNVLTVKYHVFSAAEVAATVICYESICIATSKQISEINSIEIISPGIFELI